MIHIYLTACLVFFVMSAFFAASEISYVSSNLLKLRHRQHKGDRRAKKVYRLLLKPERFLVTNLIGVNISTILSASFLTFVLMSAGIKNSHLWITFIFTPLVVIFADLIPKNIGRFFREEFSCRTVNIIQFFEFVFSPFIYIIETISYSIVRIFMPGVKRRSFFVTKEEIKSLVKDIEKQGGIDRGEKEAIEEVFEFRRDKVKDVCTLRKEVVALDYSDSREAVLDIVNKYNFTRYPVYRNKNITGYINIYELFYHPLSSWQTLIRPITRVGLNQKLYEVFTLLKSNKETMALVLKGRKVYGIVTLQNIITEIISSIIKA